MGQPGAFEGAQRKERWKVRLSEELKRNVLTPWKVSLGYAGLGMAFTLFLLIFPVLRSFPLTDAFSVHASVIVLCLPLVAAGWAITGLLQKGENRRPRWCYVSLATALVSIALAGFVFWFDPF